MKSKPAASVHVQLLFQAWRACPPAAACRATSAAGRGTSPAAAPSPSCATGAPRHRPCRRGSGAASTAAGRRRCRGSARRAWRCPDSFDGLRMLRVAAAQQGGHVQVAADAFEDRFALARLAPQRFSALSKPASACSYRRAAVAARCGSTGSRIRRARAAGRRRRRGGRTGSGARPARAQRHRGAALRHVVFGVGAHRGRAGRLALDVARPAPPAPRRAAPLMRSIRSGSKGRAQMSTSGCR
jgi:hypothetical protein